MARRFVAGAWAAAIAVGLALGPTLVLHLAPSALHGSEDALGPGSPPVAPALAPPAPGLGVISTLDLADDEQLPGNVLPENGLGPYTDVYDSGTGQIFTADLGSGTVSVIDPETNQLVATVPVGSGSLFLAYDSARGEVFVSDLGSSAISVINDSRDAVVATVSTPSPPTGIVYDNALGEIFFLAGSPFSCQETHCIPSLYSLSDTNLTVASVLPIGGWPYGLTFDSGTGQLFAVNYDFDAVEVIQPSPAALVANVTVGDGPVCAAYDPGTGQVFVANEDSDTTSVILDSTDTVVATVPGGDSPGGIEDDAVTGDVYVANYYDANISVISASTDTVVGTVDVGVYPWGGAYDPASAEMYFVNGGSNSVSVILTLGDIEVVATVVLGANPRADLYDAGQRELFVTTSNTVTVLSAGTRQVLATIPVDGDPSALAYDPAAGEVFVARTYDDTVSIISDTNNTIVATIPVGSSPDALAYDAARGELFVANYGSNNVTVLEPDGALVTSVPVGVWPSGLTYDGPQDEVFVSNELSGNLSVISDVSNTVVGTDSLPTETSPSLQVIEPEPEGLAYDPAQHEVFVANAASGVVDALSTLTDKWVHGTTVGGNASNVTYDSLTGDLLASTGSGAKLVELSGSTGAPLYAVPVGAGAAGIAIDALTETIEVSNTLQGTISTVNGTEPVTFRAVGLPAGSTWTVTTNLTGGPRSNVTGRSTGSITLQEPVGTLNFTVSAPAGYGVSRVTGPDRPSQSAATITGRTTLVVHFGPFEPLTFDELHLAAGTVWSVTIRSAYPWGGPPSPLTNATNGSSVGFVVIEGPWSYIVTVTAPYVAHPAHGTATVGPRSRTVTIRFT